MKKAIYAGSFDPFTKGHLDVVEKACGIFDEIVILIAVNKNKKRDYGIEDSKEAIMRTLRTEGLISKVYVDFTDDLIANYAKSRRFKYLIRGLRDVVDYNYEENIARINKAINPVLETVYVRAENSAISSSMVKELIQRKMDVSDFVPIEIEKLMKGEKSDETNEDLIIGIDLKKLFATKSLQLCSDVYENGTLLFTHWGHLIKKEEGKIFTTYYLLNDEQTKRIICSTKEEFKFINQENNKVILECVKTGDKISLHPNEFSVARIISAN